MEEFTLIMTRYDEENTLVKKSLVSLSKQKFVKIRVLFLDQILDNDIKLFCDEISNNNIIFEYVKIKKIGLSYAKNYGLKLCKTNLVLFYDPDQFACDTWAYELYIGMKKFGVPCSTGSTFPVWEKNPLFISKSNLVKEFYSIKNYGVKYRDDFMFFGGNVLFDLSFFDGKLVFPEHLGRQNGTLLSGEDAFVSSKIFRAGQKIIYCEGAKVNHFISEDRISYLWVFRRVFAGGYGKALRKKMPRQLTKKCKFDYLVIFLILPFYFSGYLLGYLKKFKFLK